MRAKKKGKKGEGMKKLRKENNKIVEEEENKNEKERGK